MNQEKIYTQNWKYKESFIVVSALFLGTILLDLFISQPSPKLSYPSNIIALILCVNISIFIQLYSKISSLAKWLSSVHNSVASLSFFLILTLTLALVPQDADTNSMLFVYNVTSSWSYFVASAYLIIILGAVTLKRINKFNKKNIGFFLNHFGLWLTISSISLGAGDIKKYSMEIKEGETQWLAFDKEKKVFEEMSFAFELQSFVMEEFPAKLGIFNNKTSEIASLNNKKQIFEADTTKSIGFMNYSIIVKKHLPTSIFFNNIYYPMYDIGATQSYYVNIINKITNDTISGWIGSGSISQIPRYLEINEIFTLAVLKPEAQRYASKIKVYEENGAVYNTVIDVNKPLTIGDYKIYQTGYDDAMGRWSNISIFEIVLEPWLIFSYIGIIILLLGSIFIIWVGKYSK